MIVLNDVSKSYSLSRSNQVNAVYNINLRVEPGEFVVITGRSGSGKTTLLNLIAGLARPTTGTVLLDNMEIWRLPDWQQALMRNRKIGFIFQFPSLMPSLNVLENVLLPTAFDGGRNRDEVLQRAVQLLEEVGLVDKITAFPRQISAGQQQRVVIARSLINQPEVLLADEPTSNLDEQTEREVMLLLQRFNQTRGITVMLVTHSVELVSYGVRSVRMIGGQIQTAEVK
jgi:ABC-type lipoprotein export system ATPase subunit